MISTSDVSKEFILLDPYQKFILKEFNKPIFDNIFNTNLQFLKDKKNYKTIQFSKDIWNYNPMKFAYDHYEYMHFSSIILLTNNISNTFQFTSTNLKNIVAPKFTIIKELIDKNLYS